MPTANTGIVTASVTVTDRGPSTSRCDAPAAAPAASRATSARPRSIHDG